MVTQKLKNVQKKGLYLPAFFAPCLERAEVSVDSGANIAVTQLASFIAMGYNRFYQ
jgi:hypothetical protein